MNEEKAYKLAQYATGRANSTAGYNFSRSSDSGSLIAPWMSGKTRSSHITNDMPTLELQTNLNPQSLGNLILCESRHVENDYDLRDGVIYKKPTRPYDFSHYLILPAPEDAAEADRQVQAAVEMLLCEHYFLDPWKFQQIAKEKDPAPFTNLVISEKEIRQCWDQVFPDKSAGPKLTGDHLAYFLARFWEACWARACGSAEIPLMVVATSPERNAQTKGLAVIPDGILFFHDHVLPYLPEAVRQMVSISFGCIGEQYAAQQDTACMVCYPEAATLSMDGMYAVYNDRILDRGVNEIYLTIGQHMLSGRMPEYYRELCARKNSRAAAQDFDIIYLFTEMDIMLSEIESVAVNAEQRKTLIQDCINGFPQLQNILAEYNFTVEEITKVLYTLEKKLAEVSLHYVKDYQQDLYLSWLKHFDSLKDRSGLLSESEQKRLHQAWQGALTKAFAPVNWAQCPLMDLCSHSLSTEHSELLLAIVSNDQPFCKKLAGESASSFSTLLSLQQLCRLEGYPELADELWGFLNSHCEQDEELLSAIHYLETLRGQKAIPQESRDCMLADFLSLIQRHLTIRKAQSQSFLSLAEVMDELHLQDEIRQQALTSPLRITPAEFTVQSVEMELLLPTWYAGSTQSYHGELYRALLHRAISLKDRCAELSTKELRKLENTYTQCLTRPYSDVALYSCPLAEILQVNWQDTTRWELKIVVNALQAECAPCDFNDVVERLVRLRQNKIDETANAYLELALSKYPDRAELLNKYLQKTIDLQTVDHEVKSSFLQDVFRMLSGMSSDIVSWRAQEMELLSNWFARFDGRSNEKLTIAVEDLFVFRLNDAISRRMDQAALVQLYCGVTKLHSNENHQFLDCLFKQLDDKELGSMNNCQDSLTALHFYSNFDGTVIKRLREILAEKINNKRKLSLKPGDVLHVISFSNASGLTPVTNEICSILEETSCYRMPQDVLSALCSYGSDHRESLDSLINAFMLRAKQPNVDNLEQRIEDLIGMLNRCQYAEDRKARIIQQVTRTLLPLLPATTPSEQFLSMLLPAAEDARSFNEQVKWDMMDWCESLDSRDLFPLMDRICTMLDISRQDDSPQRPKWSIFFLDKAARILCQEIRDKQLTLSQILRMTNERNPLVDDLNDQYAQVTPLSQLAQDVGEIRMRTKAECRSMIVQDTSLRDADVLSSVINQVNACTGDAFFTTCVTSEAYEHIGNQLKDDHQFRSIAQNSEAIRDLRRCFAGLETTQDKSLRSKELAVNSACRLFDFYDEVERRQSVSAHQLYSMLTSFDRTDWDVVSAICMEYGMEHLKECSDEVRVIPFLLDAIESPGDPPRFAWRRFLNSAFPLEGEIDWMDANIWKDTENTFGMLSLLLHWLSQEGLEGVKASFVAFLNASRIGRNAHARKKVRELKRHYDPKMRNSMLDWLLDNT